MKKTGNDRERSLVPDPNSHARLKACRLSLRVEPQAKYRVVMPNFLWAGGDRFTVAAEGTDAVTGSVDIDALIAYIGAHSPLSPTSAGTPPRIRRLNQ